MNETLKLLDSKLRREPVFVGRTVERLERVTRITGPTAGQLDNLILWSDLTEENIADEIQRQVAYFQQLGHSFEWIIYGHDQPADFGYHLLAAGFEWESQEQVVIREAERIPPPDPPEGIELRIARSEADIAAAISVQDAVWGHKYYDFLVSWLNRLVSEHFEQSIIVTAWCEGQPVGSAWAQLFNHRPFAPFFGGSVLPEFRGRGVYRSMVAARAQAAHEKGIRWCLVDAGKESLPILQRNGFEVLTSRTCFVKHPT